MPELGRLATHIRSKNAGPFWLTVDIFCPDAVTFTRIRDGLPTERVAAAFRQPPEKLMRFDIAPLKVIKFSLPRIVVQGSREDRDMHASQWGWLVAEISVD